MILRLPKPVVVLMLAGLLLSPPGHSVLANHARGGDLLPDLLTAPPQDLSIEVAGAEKRLRFSNEIYNKHTGAMEIFPQEFTDADADDCNADGNPGNDRVVFQRIYQDKDGDGVFNRSVDTASRARPAGCMIFHPAHNHWHFDDFSIYELKDLTGKVVAQGGKQSVCVQDTSPVFNLPGTPSTRYYPHCETIGPQGTSAGWSDVYRATLPDQYIVVTGIPDGEYCLLSTADPDNLLIEVDETNNTGGVRLKVQGNTLTPLPSEPCWSSSAPLPAPYLVYDDALVWANWSWKTTIDANSTAQVFSGQKAMSVSFNSGWAGLSLHADPFDISGYSHLRFAVLPGGQPLSAMTVSLYGPDDKPLKEVNPVPYASDAGLGWYRVSIPLADLAGAATQITRVQLQDNTGKPQPPISLDELGFQRQFGPNVGPLPTYFIYKDSLSWANWSWKTKINPNNTSPVLAGGKSLSVTYTARYAGLALHTGAFETSSYAWLCFAIHPGELPLSAISVSLFDSKDKMLLAVSPQPYATPAGNGWYRVGIPLADLRAENMTVTRVQLQENLGAAQPAFYLDDVGFAR